MPLNAKGQRTLVQVRTGLCILYGADYFTEDEWIKLDGLIHKGKYVFTNGPPQNHLEEELMNFDDTEDVLNMRGPDPVRAEEPSPGESRNPLSVFSDPNPALEKEDPVEVSPVTSNESATDQTKSGTPDEPTEYKRSGPVSAPEEPAEITSNVSAEVETKSATIVKKQPSITSPVDASPRPTPNGLAAGFTQAQLDEVKAFNARLTKAGQKKKPKYTEIVEETSYPSPAWSEHGENGLPTAAEQDARITSWADEVNEVEPVPEISPRRSPSVPVPVVVPPQAVKQPAQQRVANDIHQRSNSQWNVASADVHSSSSRNRGSGKPKVKRGFFGTPGAVYQVYSAFQKTANNQLEVLPGDQVQYIKHVSGITHRGANLRTKLQGHFPETVFTPSPDDVLLQQNAMYSYGHGRADSFVSNAIDKVEAMNAAEWDRESVSSRPTTAGGPAPPPARPLGGLAGSRFAALAAHSDSSQFPTFLQAESRQIIREELAQAPSTRAKIQELHQTATPHEGALTNVLPKTNTCWFWKNKNDCRFTAEECRDLHADLPPLHGQPTNLRDGRPTWGSLADALPPPALPILNASTPNIDFKIFSKSKTCYYWATDGKCANSAEDCKYLHEYTPAGVAPRPYGYSNHKKDFNWSKRGSASVSRTESDWQANSNSRLNRPSLSSRQESQPEPQPKREETPVSTGMATEEAWGNPEPEEALIQTSWGMEDMDEDHLNNPNAAIWGAVEGSSAWDTSGDANEPPHVRALREKQRIEAVGW